MSDPKPKAQEDKDAETASDSPGRTQEPLQSHTFSLKNNAAGLSSDEHENPLNGTQPNPFVYSSVPAVPHAGNSLPSGALVNGPGSHPTSEVHCVLNKGTVLSNNVLDAVWQVEKDTSPEVLRPPSELQSDAWKNTAGPAVKTLATQPGVNTPLSHSEENESKLASSTLSGDSAEQMHISQPQIKRTIKTRSQQGVEWSESSADDYGDAGVIRWDSARERYLHGDRRQETEVRHRRHRMHSTHVESMSGSLEKVTNGIKHTGTLLCSSNDVRNVDIATLRHSLCTHSYMKYPVVPIKDSSSDAAADSELCIFSTAQEGCKDRNDPEDDGGLSPKVEQLKAEQLQQDPLFFSCPICKVNFKEKRHFHRHMMYHLDKHNQVNSEKDSQAFICRECGRLFCDRDSLTRHIIIHQDRLVKLSEGIKDLENTEFEDGATAEQCPHCARGGNCPEMIVQHATTHDNLKHYYFCEQCNYITLTQQALEAHLHVVHLDAHQPRFRKTTRADDAEETGQIRFQCKMGFFTSGDKVRMERQSEQHPHYSKCKRKFDDHPGISLGKQKSPSFPGSSGKNEASCIERSNDKSEESSQLQCHVSCNKNRLLPSLWRIDKHGKLLLQPAEKLDVATDLTCVEEDAENNGCKAFGSSKQANCAADFTARNLKLDQMFCQGSKNDPASASLQVQANQHSPSMRKVSTPLHNTIDSLNGNTLPKLSQRLKKQSAVRELEKGWKGSSNFSKDTSAATGSFLESNRNERNPYARGYFRKRRRFSGEVQSPHTLEEEEDDDCSDIEQLIIKEEYTEATVCDSSPTFPCVSKRDNFKVHPVQVAEHKPCPYCPAVFESGVGLSNHVRGHLHRVGLSYNARHMVSPEQVALRDRQPRIRRRVTTGMRRLRKVVKPENQMEHTCPLCWGWFDTKTGLSNHVRGHLKRIGRSVTSTRKSPLCILNELLRDKNERRNMLQVVNKSKFPSCPLTCQTFGNGLLRTHSTISEDFQCEPMLDQFVPKRETKTISESKKLQAEAQKYPQATPGTLFELLKVRQKGLELMPRHNQEAYASRKICMEKIKMSSVEPNWNYGECDSSKICIQCNGTFPAALCQSGPFQTYAHRKRIAIMEKPGYDYKRKKPRPRPGLKQKSVPSLNADIYTLTCRFCDLVFQGPLSVQEDWIKHLQRHLLHTSVPHSGTGMVEVLGLHHKIEISVSHEHTDLV